MIPKQHSKLCPKCGKPLALRHLLKGPRTTEREWSWGHEYSMSEIMSGKEVCDYVEKVQNEVADMPKEENNNETKPAKFRIIPHYSPITGILNGFTVEDPDGAPVTKWREYITEINKRYPAIHIKELEEAKVKYFQYIAAFTLGRASFTLDQLKGKPAVSEMGTPQRLARYGVPEEEYEKVIEMDKNFNLNELREMCRDLGLATGGDKKKLISRLMEAERVS